MNIVNSMGSQTTEGLISEVNHCYVASYSRTKQSGMGTGLGQVTGPFLEQLALVLLWKR